MILLVFRAARNAHPGNRDRRLTALEAAAATIIQTWVMGWTNSGSEPPGKKTWAS